MKTTSMKFKKCFLTHSVYFYIGIFIDALPFFPFGYLVTKGFWWFIFPSLFFSFVFHISFCNRVMRIVSFKNGQLRVSRSPTPIHPIQRRVQVLLEDVAFADFTFVQGDSNGKPLFRSWDTPCIALTLKDESVEHIILLGFTMKQIREMDELLHELCPNILFVHDSSYLERMRWF